MKLRARRFLLRSLKFILRIFHEETGHDKVLPVVHLFLNLAGRSRIIFLPGLGTNLSWLVDFVVGVQGHLVQE